MQHIISLNQLGILGGGEKWFFGKKDGSAKLEKVFLRGKTKLEFNFFQNCTLHQYSLYIIHSLYTALF